MIGWISLHRKFLEWEWYTNNNVKSVFIHCLLMANIEDKKWQGMMILRGQFFTSYGNMAKELKLSVKQIRNCLDYLKKTGEVASKGASKGTMITVCKYENYQFKVPAKGQAKGQTEGKQGASEGQQLNNIDNKNNKRKYIISEFEIVFNRWLDYKRDRKESYKNEDSIKAAYNKLIKLSGNNPVMANEIIEQSLANNWAGLFELKDKLKKLNDYEV